MGMNDTPLSERLHIGIFGKRNAGKSSIINAMTGQDLAIVSDVAGTTTDPVQKAMELLPLGSVVMIDTPGLDDVGDLGKMRVEKAYQVLQKTDIDLIVIDASIGKTAEDTAIFAEIQKRNIPYLIVKNKADLKRERDGENEISVSAKTGENIHAHFLAGTDDTDCHFASVGNENFRKHFRSLLNQCKGKLCTDA